MADGNLTQTFEKLIEGDAVTGYSSSVIENGTKTIRTYDLDFNVIEIISTNIINDS